MGDAGLVDEALRQQAAQRSTWLSVCVNICLAVLQVGVGLWATSQALVADGVHSLSDLVADFVVLLANRHSRKDADEDHHYGHQRYETGASLALGILLILVGAGMLVTAVQKIDGALPVAKVQVAALYIALIALCAKEALFRYMIRVAERIRSSLLIANAWHARSDAASSLLVAVGIGGNVMGYPLLDPVAALVVGLMIARMGWKFGWNALNDLMDRSASQEQIEAIHRLILQTPGVQGLHELRTRKMGDMILVDAHVEVDGELSVKAGHDIAAQARARVMHQLPVLDVLVHLDPVDSQDPPMRKLG